MLSSANGWPLKNSAAAGPASAGLGLAFRGGSGRRVPRKIPRRAVMTPVAHEASYDTYEAYDDRELSAAQMVLGPRARLLRFPRSRRSVLSAGARLSALRALHPRAALARRACPRDTLRHLREPLSARANGALPRIARARRGPRLRDLGAARYRVPLRPAGQLCVRHLLSGMVAARSL